MKGFFMNEIQVRESPGAIIERLDEARRALTVAQTDFERLRIRDQARTVEAAAKILNRRDIQVQASILVQQAERAIAKANPPMSRQESGAQKGKKVVTPEDDLISRSNLRNIRQSHSSLEDSEFTEIIEEATKNEEPLTRKTLLEVSKRKKQTENRQKRDEQLAAQATQLPTGEQKYTVIYADPPWEYNFSETITREIANHYPTMPLADIKAIEIAEICHADAVLYLWATAPKLPEALEVMTAWGFTYKSNAVWVKDKIGMGYWWRNQHELLLIGTRGNFPPPPSGDRVPSVIEAPREAHSVKPVAVAELLQTLYPAHAKIELFARNRRAGWAVMGNEIDQLSSVSVSCVSCSQ